MARVLCSLFNLFVSLSLYPRSFSVCRSFCSVRVLRTYCQEYQFILCKKKRRRSFANCIIHHCHAFDEDSFIFGFDLVQTHAHIYYTQNPYSLIHSLTRTLHCRMPNDDYNSYRKGDMMQQHVSYRIRKLLRFCVFLTNGPFISISHNIRFVDIHNFTELFLFFFFFHLCSIICWWFLWPAVTTIIGQNRVRFHAF